MIFYFSGTNNSKYVACLLAKQLDDKIFNIADCIANNEYIFKIESDEKVGFVFPIYAWRAPKILEKFVKKISISGNNIYFYAIATCGDECGLALQRLSKHATKNNIDIKLLKSIVMPNNFLPLGDIDSAEEIKNRLKNAQVEVSEIVKKINKCLTVSEVHEGRTKYFKTNCIAPFFNAFFRAARGLKADDKCNKCGLCANICPTKNIIINADSIQFCKKCTNCLGCLHRCPQKAIQWRTSTQNKGRYYCPNELIEKIK